MVRDGYKQTEVGEIPDDWNVKKIGSLAPLQRGFDLPNRLLQKGSYPVAYSNGIQNYHNKFMVKGPGVFTGRSGTIGKVHYISGDYWPHNTSLWVTNFNDNFPKYIYYVFCKQNLSHFASGSGVPTLNRNDVHESLVALPNPKEQKAIAKALSDVDELIVSLEKMIAKKCDIKTATMQQLLTGKKRLAGFGEGKGYKQTELGEIPEDWDVKSLGKLLKIKHGKSQKDVLDANGEYPILATGGVIGRATEPLYSKPSVLIGRKGTIDIPYYMDTPFWTVDTLFYSEVANNANAKFLYYKFLFIDWYQYNEASGVPSLNAATIEKIVQSVPSTKEEQIAISSLLTNFDTEIESLQFQLEKSKYIKQGMMQELLTGKTRLPFKEDAA